MNPNHRPTEKQLRLHDVPPGLPLADAIAARLGDPCYPGELGSVTRGYSRKQIQKAIQAVHRQGRAVVYGGNTRRLMASPRQVPDALLAASARMVRVLQYMPLEGRIEIASIENRSSQSGESTNELVEAGLARRHRGVRKTVELTAAGREAASSLGHGLRLDALPDDRAAALVAKRDTPLTALARHLVPAWHRLDAVADAPGGWRRRLVDRYGPQRVERLRELAAAMTTPWSQEEVAAFLGVSPERVRQIDKDEDGLGPDVVRIATVGAGGTFYASNAVVVPPLTISARAIRALPTIPGGWFTLRDGVVDRSIVNDLLEAGVLERTFRRVAVHRLSQGGRWVMECLGFQPPVDDGRGPARAYSIESDPIRELVVAMSVEMRDAGIETGLTTELVNLALRNVALPPALKVELTIASMTQTDMVARRRSGRASRHQYDATSSGATWVRERGVVTRGAAELARWWIDAPQILRGSGVPDEAPRVLVLVDGHASGARHHLGLKRLDPTRASRRGTPRSANGIEGTNRYLAERRRRAAEDARRLAEAAKRAADEERDRLRARESLLAEIGAAARRIAGRRRAKGGVWRMRSGRRGQS